MIFPFVLVCDLLEEVRKLCINGNIRQVKEAVHRWFARHRDLIDFIGKDGDCLLSILLPERRTDRVYCIQASRLELIVKRSQGLGDDRFKRLCRYREAGLKLDLGDCVQQLLSETWTHDRSRPQVTVQEIDELLHSVAALVRFSSPAIQARKSLLGNSSRNGLEVMYTRLSPMEAKWFTRLILKDYRPIEMEESWILWCYDPNLQQIMKVKDDFTVAVSALHDLKAAGQTPDVKTAVLKPTLGTKVGRPFWRKGRSIKHCLDMGYGRMSVEKKIDGEYCQIHIDLSKMCWRKERCIQIFSKSGKDSTEDRKGLFGPILDSLGIGLPGCKISKGCILEGELVVYSDLEQKILPFHRIRNYVSRRGMSIGTELDSPPRAHEHLMIVYYDVLLIDDESLLGVRHSERFDRLTRLVNLSRGRSELVNRQIIDFHGPHAASDLRNMFARTITSRQEGLVLKPDDPFIDLGNNRREFSGSPIKLKKEYIGNFGDVGDFAVVAARYDPDKAKSFRTNSPKWTHFFLGCLTNKASLGNEGTMPEFTLVAVVDLNETQMKTVTTFSNPKPVPLDENRSLKLSIPAGVSEGKPPTVVFTRPLVFDLRCFDFDKPGNVGFYTPRFPVVSKVHFDRDFHDTVTFSKLQEMAEAAPTENDMEDSQELKGWIAALEAADPRGIAVDAVSQETVSTIPSPTPQPCSEPTFPSVTPQSPTLSLKSARQPTSSLAMPTMTPPPPSLPAGTDNASSEYSQASRSSSQASSQMPTKRKLGAGHLHHFSQIEKRQKQAAADHNAPSSQLDLNSSSPSHREPLSQVTGNASPHNSQITQSSSLCIISDPDETENIRKLFRHRNLSKEAPRDTQVVRSPSPSHHYPDEKNGPAGPPSAESGSEMRRAECAIAGSGCRFRKCHFMVTSNANRVSRNLKALLRNHGVDEHFTDHKRLSRIGDKELSSRMICLVDAHSEEDIGLLKAIKIERDGLGDVRKFIEVYDWRILESVSRTEADEAAGKGNGTSKYPWKRWNVGLV